MNQPNTMERLEDLIERLESLLALQAPTQEWYTIEEAAKLLGKQPYTVREWARCYRIRAEKRLSGRGAHPAWVIHASEIERYRHEGLLAPPKG